MEAMNGIPPQIPGYTFAQKLGSGSEANVYLYQQLSPSRQVAIKVSKGTLDPRAAARFRSEANFMGRISSHPYILSVYESGITATGVMIGLHRYGKRVKRMHLVATAPDRRGFIHETLKKYGADREFEYHDLFHSPGFVYEKSAAATWGGIRLHPHYEAKTMQWFRSSGIAPESTLFWITGAEPRSPGQS